VTAPDRGTAEAAELFDRYASRYADTVNASIGASGESVEYFAWLKADLMRRAYSGSPPTSVLDFGCGTGLSTRALRGVFPATTTVTGADPSEDSIRSAVKQQASDGGDVSFRVSTDERLPFADSAFDAVFTACVFHHIDRGDHVRWLREIRRVLAPGGALFLFEHNPFNPLTRRAVRDCPFDEGVILLQPSYAGRTLRAAGFSPQQPHYYFFFPTALRVLRPLEPLLRRVPVGAQYYIRAAS
jgi:ubiquinone/menaquinone biosynthesis C-methylase UbiE